VVETARANYLAAGVAGHLTVPGATGRGLGRLRAVPRLLRCRRSTTAPGRRGAGTCWRRTRLRRSGAPEPRPDRAHRVVGQPHARAPAPATRSIARRKLTEAVGARDARAERDFFMARAARGDADLGRRSVAPGWHQADPRGSLVDLERQASFFLTGGLVAVHADGRGRDAIWDALKPRARSTPPPASKILLWLDRRSNGAWRIAGDDGRPRSLLPRAPRFRVRAAGSFVQKPGCPADVLAAVLAGAPRAAVRRASATTPTSSQATGSRGSRSIRIRPQDPAPTSRSPGSSTIPWRTLPCPDQGATCCDVSSSTTPTRSPAGRAVHLLRARDPGADARGQRRRSLRCERDGDQAVRAPVRPVLRRLPHAVRPTTALAPARGARLVLARSSSRPAQPAR
jgi:hypothetical protein